MHQNPCSQGTPTDLQYDNNYHVFTCSLEMWDSVGIVPSGVHTDVVTICQRCESSVRARQHFNFKLNFRRAATDVVFNTKRRAVTAGARPVSGKNRQKSHRWQLGTWSEWICDWGTEA
jgi:hypothetical protein